MLFQRTAIIWINCKPTKGNDTTAWGRSSSTSDN